MRGKMAVTYTEQHVVKNSKYKHKKSVLCKFMFRISDGSSAGSKVDL